MLQFQRSSPRFWRLDAKALAQRFQGHKQGSRSLFTTTGRSRPFYGVSKAMKSRYMFGGWLFPAFGQKTCAIIAAALICTPWRACHAVTSEPSGSDPDLEHQHGDILSQPWLSLGRSAFAQPPFAPPRPQDSMPWNATGLTPHPQPRSLLP